MTDKKDMEGVDRFKLVKQMLDAGQEYNFVVAAVAQLWQVTPRQAEQQMTAAGYGRMKYGRLKTETPKETPKEKTAESKPAPEQELPKLKEKAKRAAPKSRIKWDAATDAQLLAMWETGTPAEAIARKLGATPSAVTSRISALRKKTPPPLPETPSAKDDTDADDVGTSPKKKKKKRAWRGLGRELVSSMLADYGLLGRAIDNKLFGGKDAEKEKKSGKGGAKAAMLRQMTLATTRGLADLTRRISIMGKTVGDALAAATATIKGSSGIGAAFAKKPGAAESNGAHNAALGLLGLLGAAGAGLLMMGGQAEGSQHPATDNGDPDPDPIEPPAPIANTDPVTGKTPDEKKLDETDHELREKDEAERESTEDLAISAKDMEFKADTIEFKADAIKGLDMGSGSGPGGNKHGIKGGGEPDGTLGSTVGASGVVGDNFGLGDPTDPTDPTDGDGGVGNPAGDAVSRPNADGSQTDASTGPSQYKGVPGKPGKYPNESEIKAAAKDQAVKEGLTPEAAENAASAHVGQAISESGLKSQFHDKGRQLGRAGGYVPSIYGADRARGQAMTKWLTDNKLDPDNPSHQARWMIHEAMSKNPNGTYKYPQSAAAMLRNDPNLSDILTKEFEAPASRFNPNTLAERRRNADYMRGVQTAPAEQDILTRKDPEPSASGSIAPGIPGKADRAPAVPSFSDRFSPSTENPLKPVPNEGALAPPSVERAPIKDDLERESVDRATPPPQTAPTVTRTESSTAEPAQQRPSDIEVIDTNGPVFGGGKSKVAGLDSELSGPWA